MIQEHTKIHFRTITGVLIPKSENRIFLNKLASEDPFKGGVIINSPVGFRLGSPLISGIQQI